MYLKEISASGFKSFADKLSIELDNDITCIVGPNGSGKSNVVDAVRWVLGEQSVKSLRGDGAMSDVIFSGSKSRNPLNVASVSLTFDNSDQYLKVPYSEVSIKRRVYRSGENEYFLNGEKCRLKDITDLFLDSGIGKESFNIISQGEVQKILSNSPYDRRIIFEEAAGVLKYKKRKEEAFRKLDRTHQNMDRVQDILVELENQVGPLKEQSEKASLYLENKKNLEQVEVALLAYEIESTNDRYQVMKREIAALEEEIVKLSNTSSGSDVRVDQMKVDLLRLEKEMTSLQEQLLTLTKEEEKTNGEKRILKERSKYDAKDQRVHDAIANLKEQKLSLDTEIVLMEKDLANDRVTMEEENKKVTEQYHALSSLQTKKEQAIKERQFKQKERLELENKMSILTSSIERGGNLNSSVRAVKDHPKLTGVHDVIGNLVEVDLKFSKALEVALGGAKQFLVVENELVAKEAIQYLKENRLGRCTFFPLNVIRPKGVDPETMQILKQEMGFVDVFAELVHFDPKYRSIIYNQLGNVLVALDLDSANRISKRIHERYKIVTLDGEIIHVGGSITGGTVTPTRSVITDKMELEKYKITYNLSQKVLKELEDSIEELEQNIQKAEIELSKKRSDLVVFAENLRNKEQIYLKKQDQRNEIDLEYRSLEHVVDSSLSKEEERIMTHYYEIVQAKEELVMVLKTKTKEKERLKATIDEMEATTKVSNSTRHKLESELKTKEIQISKMDLEMDQFLRTLSEDYELTFEKAKQNYTLEIEVDEARQKVSAYKSAIKQIGMVNLDSIEEFEKVNTRYQFLLKQKEDLDSAKVTLLEIIEEMDTVMQEEFIRTFHLVQKEFGQVFQQLFGGGKAELRLTDPDHLLETGVEIIASPPGKKLTTISLLSGGEKTLTAISLLFAILNVRTVPFCLFDEVEAALDEANVDHFGKYLDHYKSKTQFLLITHKKKTMEYAKTLYGITMQESGVSKLVSVKFDQEEKGE